MAPILAAGSDAWGIWHAAHPDQIPWERYLDEVAEAGYRFVEPGLLGYLPVDAAETRKALAARGLRIPAGTYFTDILADGGSNRASALARFDKAAAWLADLGAGFLVQMDTFTRDPETGAHVRPREMSDGEWRVFADTLQHLGERARNAHGLGLVFHPHCDEVVETEDEIARLLDMTDPALVNLCLDTGHHLYSGGDPVSFWRRHHERIPYLHLKSMNARMLETVRREDLPWAVAVARGVTDEPARGAVDFPAFAQALRDTRYNGYAAVEQDMFPCDPAVPLPLAKRTIKYLEELGFSI